MADFKIEVVRQAITTAAASNTQDFTITGFGTPVAAVFFMTDATTDDTISNRVIFSTGFTDGTRQFCGGVRSDDGQGTTKAGRRHSDSRVIIIPNLNGTEGAGFSFDSFITDGVRIRVETTTSIARLVTCYLIGGSDVTPYVNHVDLGTGTSAVNITDPSFEPNLVWLSTIGLGAIPGGGSTNICSFGVGHNTAGNPQAFCGVTDLDSVTTTNVNSYISNASVSGQVFSGSLSWSATIGDYDASGFSLTPSSSTGGDIVGYLALKVDNNPDISLFDMQWPTSGNYAETTPGFEPSFGLICSLIGPSSRNTLSNHYGFSIAGFDATNIFTNNIASVNGASTSSCKSISADRLRILDSDGSTDAVIASSYAFDADGWDFTLTTNPGSAVLGWGLAIGAGSATGQTISFNQAVEVDSANAITPVKPITLAYSQATETDVANSITPLKPITLAFSQATETDSARSITPSKAVFVSYGQATETDNARAFSVIHPKSISYGQATETDAARTFTPVSGALSISYGQATETDRAHTITPSGGIVSQTRGGIGGIGFVHKWTRKGRGES